eukprot:scaffold19427_cov112-Isochrysis_galbana.AAC.1
MLDVRSAVRRRGRLHKSRGGVQGPASNVVLAYYSFTPPGHTHKSRSERGRSVVLCFSGPGLVPERMLNAQMT